MSLYGIFPKWVTPELLILAMNTLVAEPDHVEWSVQGFGMFRAYLPIDDVDPAVSYRLHVWDGRFKVPNVTTIHNHPWDLDSIVLSGCVINRRYVVHGPGVLDGAGMLPTHNETPILCGEGASISGDPRPVILTARPVEVYGVGRDYSQHATEVHESEYLTGTVTLVRRSVPADRDRDHALVYVPAGSSWVDAKPRDAHPSEVQLALDRMIPVGYI